MFLDVYHLQILNQDQRSNLNISITSNEIEAIIVSQQRQTQKQKPRARWTQYRILANIQMRINFGTPQLYCKVETKKNIF